MPIPPSRRSGICGCFFAAALTTLFIPAHAQDAANNEPARGWTYEAAQAQLQMYPHDPFLQYVALKLAQRDGFDASNELGFRERTRREVSGDRRENVDLFSIFSGSLAVQESLQLDAMRPGSGFNGDEGQRKPTRNVNVARLKGPSVASHPWKKMLNGQEPEFSELAYYIPGDNYYIRFRSVSRMLDVIDGGDLFAKHLYSQTGAQAFARDTADRLRQQLAVETNALARPFYDLVVKEIVITGSDPFVNEGSDVTLIFRYEQEPVFKAQMDAHLKKAEGVPETTRTAGTFEEVPFVHLASPDRRVHVYSAYPEKGLHVRSNSQVAFERILGLIKGKTQEDLPSLGQSEEFQYIRTLMPFEAPEEDGLIYLSDPFIRRLVGPEVKLTELRRLKCFNHLRMIGHAAAMHQAEHGHAAKSLEDLQSLDCLPDRFESGELTCSCGGRYSLSADGRHGICSHHGHADALIPCCEIPESEVTEAEAAAYTQFVTEYSEYWRTFFDPIAIKVQATPEKYRLETIVLPLIENSIYQTMAFALSGESRILSGSISDDASMSLSFAIAKDRLLGMSGYEPPEEPDDPEADATRSDSAASRARIANSTNNLKQLALAMHNYHDVHNHFPAAVQKNPDNRPLLSWRVQVLPYLEEAALYDQFHMDEPWDSAHNKSLIDRMPAVFRSPGVKLAAGKTTYLGVQGEKTLFPKNGEKVRFANILDGTSNTVMFIDAAPEFAVTWTKPDDIELDPQTVRQALQERFDNGGLVAFADGAVSRLRKDLDDDTIRRLFVSDDGQVLGDVRLVDYRNTNRRRDPFGLGSIMGGKITERDLYLLVSEGIGDTIGLHVCDTDPTFDIQLTSLLSDMFGTRASRSFALGGEELWVGMAIASLTSPVYVNVSVNDTEVVDQFLSRLDEGAAIEARTHTDLGWFAFRKDFYTVDVGDTVVRSFVLSLGPIKWRFFYARIDENLVVASKLQTLEQLVAQQSAPEKADGAEEQSDSAAHAQLTIHRDHWKRIIPTMRLAWDEGARAACLDNIGPLTSTARVLAGSGSVKETPEQNAMRLTAEAESIYGGLHFCPCGGHYVRNEDGEIVCSVHGTGERPRQPRPNADNGASLDMLNSFSEVRVLLSFLEDGLHAVLEIDRTPR